jgi:hypothetical protein
VALTASFVFLSRVDIDANLRIPMQGQSAPQALETATMCTSRLKRAVDSQKPKHSQVKGELTNPNSFGVKAICLTIKNELNA